MVRYLSLISFTDKGIQSVTHSIERAEQFQSRVADAGGRVLHQYWSLGEFDGCVLFEVPDEMTGAALLLQLGQADNVRTRTTRIFDNTEFAKIIGLAG